MSLPPAQAETSACALLETRLEVLDASGSYAPQTLGQLSLSGTPRDIALQDGLACIVAQAA